MTRRLNKTSLGKKFVNLTHFWERDDCILPEHVAPLKPFKHLQTKL